MASALEEPLNLAPVTEGQHGTIGENGTSSSTETQYDPNFTDNVIKATGPKANKRLARLMPSLVRHLHDFCRENEVTVEEWSQSVEFLNECGRMSDDKRNEGQLFWDILGVESLVDEITYKVAADSGEKPTTTAILGPFWRPNAPIYPMGKSIILKDQGGDVTHMHGSVTDFTTGKPITNAEIDIWHTAPNGLYEQQDPEQPDMNLRGRFYTPESGDYDFYCLRPTPYPIPFDGPAGKFLKLLDRHPMRPAHIHFIISAKGYKPVVTQIFDRRDEWLGNDSVFAVKDSLVVDFAPKQGDEKAGFDLKYDFKLVAVEDAKNGVRGGTEVTSA